MQAQVGVLGFSRYHEVKGEMLHLTRCTGGRNGMRSDESAPDLVERLTEEYLQRRRRGERPTVAEYARCYPKLADRIIEVLPALELIERFRPTPGDRADQIWPWSAQGRPTGATAGDDCRKLGDYQLIRELGRGGMGVVYEAQRESLQKSVAIKIMHPRYQADPASVTRFLTEARSAARLHHTNIVPVFDFGQQNGVYYYVMQFIAGVGMDRVLRGCLPAPGTRPGRCSYPGGSRTARNGRRKTGS